MLSCSSLDTRLSEDEADVAHMLLDDDPDRISIDPPEAGPSQPQFSSPPPLPSEKSSDTLCIHEVVPPMFAQEPTDVSGDEVTTKRKRDITDLIHVDELVQPCETKKQRKKRRKLERLAAEAASIRSEVDHLIEDRSIHLPYSAEEAAGTSIAGPSTRPIRPLDPPLAYPQYFPINEESTTTSPWVSSMTTASKADLGGVQSSNTSFVKPPPSAPASWNNSLPPKPPPALPIGMPPDADSRSKHGVFCSPTTLQAPYVPNPARTLVMEQIPKPSRTMEFIYSWAKDVCGSHPVHVEIDTQFSKALVEFATADMARLAWSSPRLQREALPTSAKSNKVELIRVWWYRVDGINTGVGELEEGEIEGEVEKDQGLSKKETKRERKARLAKERELRQSQPIISPLPPPPPLRIAPTNATVLPRPVPTQPKAHGLPPKPVTTFLPPFKAPFPQRPLNLSLPTDNRVPPFAAAQPSHAGTNMPHPAVKRRGSSPPSNLSVEGNDAETDMEVDSPLTPSLSETLVAAGKSKVASPDLPTFGASRITRMPPPVSEPLPEQAPAKPPVRPFVPAKVATLPAVSISIETAPTTPSATTPSILSRPVPVKAVVQPPSEPRAMKKIPKQPRSFLARQKELEERLARSKAEMATRAQAAAAPPPPMASTPPILPFPTQTIPPSVSSPSTSSTSAPASMEIEVTERQTLEDNLRLLVLKSQKSRIKKTPPADTLSDKPTVLPEVKPVSPQAAAPPLSNFSLDDLAESFITESIKEAKASPHLLASMNSKVELAAKQKQLEQQIAESKLLMAKLAKAKTKEEKDTILVAMREQSRAMDDTSAPRPLMITKQSFTRIHVTWPECQQQTILELSDSEDSDLDEE